MQSFVGVSHLLSVLLLQLVPAQISHPPELGHSKVMAFQEVWAKSLCRPMEQLVDVEHEYPGEVEFIYMPACVPLWRCSGCCGDENLECQATLERNVTLQVMRIHPMLSMHHVELTFVEHQRCECRPRQKPTNNKRSVDFYLSDVKTSISSVHFAPPPQQQRLYQEQTEEEETQEDSKRLRKKESERDISSSSLNRAGRESVVKLQRVTQSKGHIVIRGSCELHKHER